MELSPYIATDAVFAPDKYDKYAEMTTLLQNWQAQYPDFVTMERIGRSYEGRDIWGITLTNGKTGDAADKRAYYIDIDANIHAGKIIDSSVVLYTINWLLTHHGSDAKAMYLLDETAFYIVPRISVDGAELSITTPTTLRSSVRPDPFAEERDGLKRHDLNSDGFITSMRVKDPTGPWKKSAGDDRLMVKRPPDEIAGAFYRVYSEGELTADPKGGHAAVSGHGALIEGEQVSGSAPLQCVMQRAAPAYVFGVSAADWIAPMISPGTAALGRAVIAYNWSRGSFGTRSAVSRPLVSCSVSVSCV